MKVSTRAVPERTVALISEVIPFEAIDAHIRMSVTRILEWAGRHPGVRAPTPTEVEPFIVVFHAAMSPGGSALVEVGAVVATGAPAGSGITVRVEPAHHEAFVTVSKEQLDYPEILEAYKAVAEWVEEHGEMIESMPTREVYFTDVVAAGRGVPVCDIASAYTPR